jgi:hypothetical protein
MSNDMYVILWNIAMASYMINYHAGISRGIEECDAYRIRYTILYPCVPFSIP